MARQSYTKELKIKVDSTELDALKEQIDKIYVDTLNMATKELAELDEADPKNFEKVKELKEAIDTLAQQAKEVEKDEGAEFGSMVKKGMLKQLKRVGENITESIQEFFKDILSEAMARLKDMATYDLGSSFITNREAREQALKYGIMDPAQNYALSQSMKELGLQDETDMMWMNDNQREKFTERMGYWAGKYNELANKDFFETMQNFTLEWEEFRSELQLGVIEFFMDNKELIKEVLVGLMKFMEKTLEGVGWLLELGKTQRTGSQRNAAAIDIVNKYSTTSTKSSDVTINNTMYPASQSITDKNMLQKAGELSYAQLIKVLKEGY